jgi:hypothetical protein
MEFAVRTTDPRFLDVLGRYLGEHRAEEGPDDIRFSADCGIEKELVGGTSTRGKKRLYFESILIFYGTALEEMAARLISGVRDWTNNQSNEFLRIRAGGVVLDGGTLLLPSAPERHLATLVALLVKRGAGYVGDEIVNIDPVVRRAHGTGLPLLLDAQDLDFLPEIADGAAKRRRRRAGDPPAWWPVRLEDLGGSAAPATETRWIIFPSFQPGRPTELRQVGKADALFRFTQAGLNLHIWMDRALVLMQELLAAAYVGELVIGDPDDAADLLLESMP